MRRKAIVGQMVEIEWESADDDWPFFKVLDMSKNGLHLELKGMPYPNGTQDHEGDVFWCKTSAIKTLKVCVKPK